MPTADNEGKLVRIVLYPRYTTFVGDAGALYPTLPVDMSPFDAARITLWHAALHGTNAALSFMFEESTDQVTWTNCQGTPSNGVEIGVAEQHVESFTPRRKWFRLAARLDGSGELAGTCYAEGVLVRRQR